MKIHEPSYLNELGGRSNNEDSIYPSNPSDEDQLFIVCDGVGGQNKGEVASKLICSYLSEYFDNNKLNIYDGGYLESGLKYVENHLKEHLTLNSECSGMASTLTILSISQKKVLIGWVGDSRVYHIRNGKILFQTKDHSEVQSLLDMGEITEEEAETHPRKNVITRAISGVNPTRIDQKVIEDIRPNDFFFLCSDGILENLNANKIEKWFKKESSPNEIKSNIQKEAEGNTKDNFSMYLIKVKEVDKKSILASPNIDFLPNKFQKKWILGVLIVALIILFISFIFNGNGKNEPTDQDLTQPSEEIVSSEDKQNSTTSNVSKQKKTDPKPIEKEPVDKHNDPELTNTGHEVDSILVFAEGNVKVIHGKEVNVSVEVDINIGNLKKFVFDKFNLDKETWNEVKYDSLIIFTDSTPNKISKQFQSFKFKTDQGGNRIIINTGGEIYDFSGIE